MILLKHASILLESLSHGKDDADSLIGVVELRARLVVADTIAIISTAVTWNHTS
jgi:hypothetical protein